MHHPPKRVREPFYLLLNLSRDSKYYGDKLRLRRLVLRTGPTITVKREVYCVNRKATASIAIKPAINNNEIVAAILFALGLSFHDRRP
jgi:hypothetical protein